MTLHVRPLSGGAGAPIVAQHGVTGCGAVWTPVASLLVGRRVLAPDLAGHGLSPWTGSYATADQAAGVLEVLPAEPVDFVGSSWGALVGLHLAVHHPERIRRLVMVDIEPSFMQSETDVMPQQMTYASLDEVVATLRPAYPHAAEEDLRAYGEALVKPEGDGFVRRHDPLFAVRWPFRSDDHWDALPKVSCPTLLVHAGQSFVRAQIMEGMHGQIPGSQLVEIPESTHVVPMDAPAALVAALRTFLG